MAKKQKRHDHRGSVWLIAGGNLIWCYQCGAWRINAPQNKWHRPSGIGGKNPAMLTTCDMNDDRVTLRT